MHFQAKFSSRCALEADTCERCNCRCTEWQAVPLCSVAAKAGLNSFQSTLQLELRKCIAGTQQHSPKAASRSLTALALRALESHVQLSLDPCITGPSNSALKHLRAASASANRSKQQGFPSTFSANFIAGLKFCVTKFPKGRALLPSKSLVQKPKAFHVACRLHTTLRKHHLSSF